MAASLDANDHDGRNSEGSPINALSREILEVIFEYVNQLDTASGNVY